VVCPPKLAIFAVSIRPYYRERRYRPAGPAAAVVAVGDAAAHAGVDQKQGSVALIEAAFLALDPVQKRDVALLVALNEMVDAERLDG
jgi:hypothetical protein